MLKHYLLLLSGYLAFVWQAALRPELDWNGYAPNFLALALVLMLSSLGDVTALIAAAGLGLLSDCLAPRSLGNDMLCFLAVSILLQAVCPPRLVRHPGWLLLIVLLATVLLEFTTVGLRSTLNTTQALGGLPVMSIQWGFVALGDGLYTALLATLPVVAFQTWSRRAGQDHRQPTLNRWHRLTS